MNRKTFLILTIIFGILVLASFLPTLLKKPEKISDRIGEKIMIIKTLTMGELEVNSYLVICEKTRDAVLIDAGGDFEATMLAVKQNNANLKYLLHTHGHYDHIIGDYDLKTKAGVKIFLHKEDKQLADKFHEQLMMFGAGGAKSPSIDEYIQDNQIIELGELKFKVIHTPGHTPGGVCYLIEDALFSGDTLFEECIGRTDFPGGSFEQLRNSIVNKLFTLKENIKVYPGHGPSTTIAHEKEFNPYFGTKATSIDR